MPKSCCSRSNRVTPTQQIGEMVGKSPRRRRRVTLHRVRERLRENDERSECKPARASRIGGTKLVKRDDMNIDEILKHYLPRASEEDVDAAGETVLKRIREMRFQAEPETSAAPGAKAANGDWLHDFHVGLLVAVDRTAGLWRSGKDHAEDADVLEAPVVSGTGVFLNLRIMETHGPGFLDSDRSREAAGIGPAILCDHGIGPGNARAGARLAASGSRSASGVRVWRGA